MASGEGTVSKFTVKINGPSKPIPVDNSKSEITVKEFLDFLKTAYQVNDSIEGVLLANGMQDAVDWIKLKESDVVRPKETAVQTSLEMWLKSNEDRSKEVKKKPEQDNDPLRQKLNEVLNEGLLDSVLPYLVAPNFCQQQRRPSLKVGEKISSHSGVLLGTNMGRRKSSDTSVKSIPTKTDSEVEIHVCDEIKGVRKEFICNQQLLVEQMGYFADVTKGQKLEDMDISVHCDIQIFEWLMRWVKRSSLLEADVPKLDANCAIPVLVSAAFLQMEPLLQECLLFCHRHMNEILKTSTSLSCLNDSVLTRLAAMYTNTEVEAIRDRKDKIQSRLYCKLIQSLCELEPESVRGHYCSFAKIYRCKNCLQLISPAYGYDIPCLPNAMSLEFDGSVTSKHVRDSSWVLTQYVAGLQKTLKSWRKVYWRMWGDAHFLYCLTCKKYFPGRQVGWCRFHADVPQFFTLDAKKPPLPVGRYPCCGERAYRFQLLDDRSGCQFREHITCTKTIKDASILSMLETYRIVIVEEPPRLVFPDRLTRLVARDTSNDDGKLECKEVMWWEGLEIVPPRQKLGLLGSFSDQMSDGEEATEHEVNDTSSDEDDSSSSSSESSSNTPGSEESHQRSPRLKKKVICVPKKSKKQSNGRLWQNNLSARSNQDLQRAFEEEAFKKMAWTLNSKTMVSSIDNINMNRSSRSSSRHITPPGGVWVRLESEWKDKNLPAPKNRNIYNGKIRMKTTRLI